MSDKFLFLQGSYHISRIIPNSLKNQITWRFGQPKRQDVRQWCHSSLYSNLKVDIRQNAVVILWILEKMFTNFVPWLRKRTQNLPFFWSVQNCSFRFGGHSDEVDLVRLKKFRDAVSQSISKWMSIICKLWSWELILPAQKSWQLKRNVMIPETTKSKQK